jgi:tRNA1Val (adenine37-N6)-methyltransferase
VILDLGSGCGVLGLAMLLRGAERLIAVEKDPQMAELISRNAKESGLSDRVEVICEDLRNLGRFTVDHVVSNPPYFKQGTGRASDNALKDAGRFERSGGLKDFLGCAQGHVKNDGTMSFVIRYDRKKDLIHHANELGCWVRRIRDVRPHRDSNPKMVMIEVVKTHNANVQEMEALTLHREAGKRDYTDEVQGLISGI